ncbi:hypothetical protein N826_06370 [Skermanella aerolata KACC 11604]|nr:hypothetical protein N826_06370 [Skermanella aerolata KACC 11604]
MTMAELYVERTLLFGTVIPRPLARQNGMWS